ncbi:MAG: hypothetical protein KGN02_07410 [bacterium]|nr:hypothetical protein [bacterium]
MLAEHDVHPIVVAPTPACAQRIVRTINRSSNVAVSLRGSDAALLPQTPSGIGRVHTPLLETLIGAGYIPVVEPTAFSIFGNRDAAVVADDVASAIGAACAAVRAIFFHRAGGITDPRTQALIDELTPAEALALAEAPDVDESLRSAMRAAALGVRGGIPAAQIVDGRVAHAAVVEVLTAHHVGTQVTGGVILAA